MKTNENLNIEQMAREDATVLHMFDDYPTKAVPYSVEDASGYRLWRLLPFSLSNRLFLTLDSVKKSLFFTLELLFFTLELLFFTLEKKPDLDIPRWRGA
jgi:hypothetical protein